MSLQYLSIKPYFESLGDDEKKRLMTELLEENTIYIRQINDMNALLAFLVIHHPENPLIKYHISGSDNHTLISSWCYKNGPLREFWINKTVFHQRILTTDNGILFDKETKSFIQPNHDFLEGNKVTISISNNIVFYKRYYPETIFPREHIQNLIKLRAISNRDKISKFLV